MFFQFSCNTCRFCFPKHFVNFRICCFGSMMCTKRLQETEHFRGFALGHKVYLQVQMARSSARRVRFWLTSMKSDKKIASSETIVVSPIYGRVKCADAGIAPNSITSKHRTTAYVPRSPKGVRIGKQRSR